VSVSCSASHVRPFAWRPIDHGQSDHVLGPSPEPDSPGGDAEALACSIVGSRGDANAQCFGLDLSGWSFAAGEFGSQQSDSRIDLLRG
jgi:hypothetical protein